VTVPVANGAQVWALPGDKIKLQYVGNVELAEGVVTWEEFDKWFLVVERTDTADASGVRQVSLVLAAPEIEMTIPSLPDAVILPITRGPEDSITTLLNELGLGDDTDLGGDGLGGETSPDCCDDPLEEIEDGPLPPEIIQFTDPSSPCADDPWDEYFIEFIGGGNGTQSPLLRITYNGGLTLDVYATAANAGMIFRNAQVSAEDTRSSSPATDWWDSSTVPLGFDGYLTGGVTPTWRQWIGFLSFDHSALPAGATIENVELILTVDFTVSGFPFMLQARASSFTLPIGTVTNDYPPDYSATLYAECCVASAEDVPFLGTLTFTPTAAFLAAIEASVTGVTQLYLTRAGVVAGGTWLGGP
jgi:hypothetical protein